MKPFPFLRALTIGALVLSSQVATTEPLAAFEGTRVLLYQSFDNGLNDWRVKESHARGHDSRPLRSGDVQWTSTGGRSGGGLQIVGSGRLSSPAIPYDGQKIEVAFDMRLEDVEPGEKHWNRAGAQVLIYDENGKPLSIHWGHYDVALEAGTLDWFTYRRRFVLPRKTKFLRVSCLLWNCKKGVGFFDNIKVSACPVDAPLVQKTLRIHANRPGQVWQDICDGIDASHAERVLHPEYVDPLRQARRLGFRYLRLHTPLAGLKLTVKGRELTVDWATVDRVLDRVTANGLTPILVTESTPEALASAPKDGWHFIHPPKDYGLWRQLMRKLVTHLENRYGRDFVRTWYFEVWNEPGASGYFAGSHAEYLKLYDYTVAGLTEADPQIVVGGPDPASDSLFTEFLEHCARGKNAVTGKRGARVDFLSRHFYGGSGYAEAHVAAWRVMRELKWTISQIARYPSLSTKPLLVTEWNDCTSPRAYNESPYAATFIARSLRDLTDSGRVDRCVFFSLVDDIYHKEKMYLGGLGLYTPAGAPKITEPVLVALRKLGGRRLAVQGEDAFTGCIATRNSDGRITLLVWNGSDDPFEPLVPPRDIVVTFSGLKEPSWRIQHAIVDERHCNPMRLWRECGAPQQPKAELIERLRKEARLRWEEQFGRTAEHGNMEWSFHAALFSVHFFELDPTP